MTQASGSASQILIVKEVDFGVVPTTPQFSLLSQASYGESLNSTSEEIISNAIDKFRSVKSTRNGLKSSDGSVPFEFSTDGSDLILEGLSGLKTGTGTSLDPFIYKRGNSVPSFSVEKGFTDINEYFLLKGMKVNSLELNCEPGQILSGSVSFLGKGDPSVSSTSADTTPTSTVHVPFTGIDTKVLIDNSEANVSSFTLNITNNLTAQNVLGSAFAKSINAGRGEVTGTISILFEDSSVFEDWLNEVESKIELEITLGTKVTKFTFNKVKYNGAGLPNIETSDGVIYTLNWRSIYDATSQSDFVISQIVS